LTASAARGDHAPAWASRPPWRVDDLPGAAAAADERAGRMAGGRRAGPREAPHRPARPRRRWATAARPDHPRARALAPRAGSQRLHATVVGQRPDDQLLTYDGSVSNPSSLAWYWAAPVSTPVWSVPWPGAGC